MISRVRTWLRAVDLPDPLDRQQSQLVQSLLLTLIAITLLAVPLPFLSDLPTGQAAAVAAVVLVELPLYVVALVLLRRGQFSQATLLASASVTLLCVFLLFCTGTRSSGATMFTFALPIVFAGLLAGRRGLYWSVGLSIAGIALVLLMELRDVAPVGFAAPRGANVGGLLGGFVAAAAVLGVFVMRFGSALQVALRQALDREREIERQRAALESAVAERTADLRGALDEVESRAAAQAALLSQVERQRQAIQELSVPLLPVSARTLVLPLIGSIDDARLAVLQERALRAAERGAVRRLILDISGVPVVDSQVALGLLSVVRATRLLGAEAVLAGIRPEVAQALVALGLGLGEVRTYRDLEDALRDERKS